MTPLIDILLVLLIIFMIISPNDPKGHETRLPQEQTGPVVDRPPSERTIVVQVGLDGIRINQERVSEEDLGARLVDIYKNRAERVCFVKGDPQLTFQDVARVVGIIKSAGVTTVGLLTGTTE